MKSLHIIFITLTLGIMQSLAFGASPSQVIEDNYTPPIQPPASIVGIQFEHSSDDAPSVAYQNFYRSDGFAEHGFSDSIIQRIAYTYSNGVISFPRWSEEIRLIFTGPNSGTYEFFELYGEERELDDSGTFAVVAPSLEEKTDWQRTETFDSALSNDYWQVWQRDVDSIAYDDGELSFIFGNSTEDSDSDTEVSYARTLPMDEDWQLVLDDIYAAPGLSNFGIGLELEIVDAEFDCELYFEDYGSGRQFQVILTQQATPSNWEYASAYVTTNEDARISSGGNVRIVHYANSRELIFGYQPDGASEWSELASINLSSGVFEGQYNSIGGNFTGGLTSATDHRMTLEIEAEANVATQITDLEISGIEISSYAPPIDSDGDGLSDNVETNTGTFVSEVDTGTDPNNADTDGDGVGDNADPFPHDPLELEKLGPSDFQPKENVGWIEVTYAYTSGLFYGQTVMPGIWHPIDENFATWFAFDNTWSYNNAYSWDPQNQAVGNTGHWSHYKTSNPNIYTCKFDWTHGTNGYGFTYDGRIDLDNDGNQDGIQIRSGIQFPAEGSQLDFNQILGALSDNLGLFALASNFTEDDYDGDGTDNALDIDDDNDGIADAYDPTVLLYTVSKTSVPPSLSGYVEVYFSDYDSTSYGVWYGSGENSSIGIWNNGVDEFIFNVTYSWDSQSLVSTSSSEYGGGIFRTNFKDKTNDAFFVFTYVLEQNELYPDDSGKGFFYDGRIDLDNNGVADGVQIQTGEPFPDSESTLDLSNIYSSAVSNFIPIEVLDYTSNEKYFSDELQDLRLGSTMIEVSGGKANITMTLEETPDLSDWSSATKSDITVEVDAPAGARFFRFKMVD